MAISLHAFDDIAIITMLPAVVEQLQGQAWSMRWGSVFLQG